MVQIISSKLRENIRKEVHAAMKNVAPGKVDLAINATEPAVLKYIELLTEMLGAMCTPSAQPPVDPIVNFAELESDIAKAREAVELKAEQVRILREHVLELWHSRQSRRT
jgi:hypothetical protein